MTRSSAALASSEGGAPISSPAAFAHAPWADWIRCSVRRPSAVSRTSFARRWAGLSS